MNRIEKNQSKLNRFIENPSKGLWHLALPIMGGMSVHTIYTICDMIFIGRVSADALAAISFNMPLFFFAIALMIGVGSGVTALVARSIGNKQNEKAAQTARHGLFIGLSVSLLLSISGSLFGFKLLGMIGTPPHLQELAWSYLQILSIGIPFLVLSSIFGSILSGSGDTKFPMMMTGLGTLLNIALDPIFIFVLDFGLRGAAIATLISQFSVFTVFSYMLFIKKYSGFTLLIRKFSPDWEVLKGILKIGLPASASLLIMAFGSLVFNKILVQYSAYAVAAYQIVGRMDMLLFLPIMAIASAQVTLVGMFHGAGELSKLRFIVHYGMKRAVILTSLGAIIVYIFAPNISAMFSKNPGIRSVAIEYFRIIAFIYPMVAISITSGRSMQGMGKGFPMLVITSTRVLLVSVPLATLFTSVWKLPINWVWYSIAISTVVSAIIAFTWIKSSLRKVSLTMS